MMGMGDRCGVVKGTSRRRREVFDKMQAESLGRSSPKE